MDELDKAELCALRVFRLSAHRTERGRQIRYEMLTERDADGNTYENLLARLAAKGYATRGGKEWLIK
jgi:hypothetical protein